MTNVCVDVWGCICILQITSVNHHTNTIRWNHHFHSTLQETEPQYDEISSPGYTISILPSRNLIQNMFNSQAHLSFSNHPTDTQRTARQFFFRGPSTLFQDRRIWHHKTQPRKGMRRQAQDTETLPAMQSLAAGSKENRGKNRTHTFLPIISIGRFVPFQS